MGAVLDGAEVKFGPGLAVVEVVTDAESRVSVLVLNGLDARISDAALVATLSRLGPVTVARKHETYAFAKFERPEDAAAALLELNGSTLSRWLGASPRGPHGQAKSERCVSLALAAPAGAIVTHSASVKVSWFAPCRVAWAHFARASDAQQVAQRCNGTVLCGRSLTAKFQQPGPTQTTSFSVWLGSVDERASEPELRRHLKRHGGAAPASVSLGAPPFQSARAAAHVEAVLRGAGPLVSFEQAALPPGALKCKALTKFCRPAVAAAACKLLHNSPVAALGGGKLFVQRRFAAKFVLPSAVFAVVRAQLTPLLETLQTSSVPIRHNTFANAAATTVAIQADTPMALSFAKGLLLPVLHGERVLASSEPTAAQLPLWHASFSRREAELALDELNATCAGKAFVSRDVRRRELRIWGEPTARARARAAVLALLESNVRQKHSVRVSPGEFRSLLRFGLVGELEGMCGARSIALDLLTRSLIVEGDDAVAAKCAPCVAVLVAKASGDMSGEHVPVAAEGAVAACPVCYCEPEEAVALGCEHTYCAGCVRDWIAVTAGGGAGGSAFPMACLAAGCARPIAIDDLRRAVPAEQLGRLMRSALDQHVNAHLDSLQFCLSPGCGGLFALGESRTAKCSACGALVCTSCRVEEHEALTCCEYLEAKLPPDLLRHRVVEEILTLRCPRCSQAFVDFDGCFAVKCSCCPCSFCGWCLADCGADAHPHVLRCPAKPAGADTYFGTREQFVAAQRARRRQKLDAFLAKLDASERARLVRTLASDLNDLGLGGLA